MAKILKNLKSSSSNVKALETPEAQALLAQVAAEQGEQVAAEAAMEIEAGSLDLGTGEPTTEAPKTITAKKADTSAEIVSLTLPKATKETKDYLITPKNDPQFGVDRWFAKKDLKDTDLNDDGQFVIKLTRKLVASRGLTALLSTGATAQ